jgi:hypothetical protein
MDWKISIWALKSSYVLHAAYFLAIHSISSIGRSIHSVSKALLTKKILYCLIHTIFWFKCNASVLTSVSCSELPASGTL